MLFSQNLTIKLNSRFSVLLPPKTAFVKSQKTFKLDILAIPTHLEQNTKPEYPFVQGGLLYIEKTFLHTLSRSDI